MLPCFVPTSFGHHWHPNARLVCSKYTPDRKRSALSLLSSIDSSDALGHTSALAASLHLASRHADFAVTQPRRLALCLRIVAPADSFRQDTNPHDVVGVDTARQHDLVAARIGPTTNVSDRFSRSHRLALFAIVPGEDHLVIGYAERDG